MTTVAIFDLDGTLIDSRADLTTGVNLMRADYGLPPLSIETVTSYVGNGARLLVERALQGAAVDVDEACAKNKAYYLEHVADRTSLYPGACEALEILRQKGYVLALATNKPEAPTLQLVEKLGLGSFFSVVLGGDSCARNKPDPMQLFFILERLKADSSGSWMVGDNYTDLEAGRRAGVKCCLCDFGFGDPHEEPYELRVNSLKEFAQFVPTR